MPRPLMVVGSVAMLAVLTACGSGPKTTRDALLEIPVPQQVSVDVRPVAGLGDVLTDSSGRTLYMFPPDAGSQVTCRGGCAGIWPPLVIADGHSPTAGSPALIAADLGTLADPNTGQRIVTYGGYPLYRYSGDLTAGTANGQALFLNGGPWYALSPDLSPVTVVPRGDS